jgi:tetrahydromethanopterin S-methyltransferase subunit G
MDAAWIKKELEAVDFTTSQANALALVLSQMATKDDVDGVRQEVGELRQHVDAGFKEVYQEFGKVRQEMGQMHQEIGQIWWKVAILMTLQAGLIVSLIKLI